MVSVGLDSLNLGHYALNLLVSFCGIWIGKGSEDIQMMVNLSRNWLRNREDVSGSNCKCIGFKQRTPRLSNIVTHLGHVGFHSPACGDSICRLSVNLLNLRLGSLCIGNQLRNIFLACNDFIVRRVRILHEKLYLILDVLHFGGSSLNFFRFGIIQLGVEY